MNATCAEPTSAEAGAAARRAFACALVSTAAIWIGLLGPAWTYVPPLPQAGTPAAELSFAALSAASAGSPSAVQAAYFGWLAWVFALVTTVGVVVLVRTGSRSVAALCAAVGLVQLWVTVAAVKGPLPWPAFLEGFADLRLGAALVLIGILLFIASGVAIVLSPAPARTPTAE